MNFLIKFFTQLFGKAQVASAPRESVTVYSQDLSTYIGEHVDTKFERSKEHMIDEMHTMRGLLEELSAQLVELEERELQNEDIPERAKAAMQGNRQAYLVKHKGLRELEVPETVRFEDVVGFINNVEKELETIKSSTGKNHMILSQFFKNELGHVNATLREVELSNGRMRKVCSAQPGELRRLQDVQKDVERFLHSIRIQQHLSEKMDDLLKAKMDVQKQQEDLTVTMKNFRKDPEFTIVSSLESSRNDLHASVDQLKDEMRRMIQPLDKALKKYQHMGVEHVDLVHLYMDNPLKAVVSDKSERFFTVLQKVRSLLESGQMEMKAKEKVIRSIDGLDRSAFKGIVNQYEDLLQKRQEVEKKIRLSNVMRNYDEMEYKLSHLQQKTSRIEQDITDTQKRLDKVNVEDGQESLERALSDALDVNVSITL